MSADRLETLLIENLLTALLRENTAGMRTRGRSYRSLDGEWFALSDVRIPVRRGDVEKGDLVTDLAVRAPYVRQSRPGRSRVHTRLVGVIRVVCAAIGHRLASAERAELAAGFAVLQAEAAAALDASRERRRDRARVLGQLRHQQEPGWAGWLAFETLAAFRDHPLHPLSAAKTGLTRCQVRHFAPEHHPVLNLRWIVLPADQAHVQGQLPRWWPPSPEGTVALPTHPATGDLGTDLPAEPAPDLPADLTVRPSLSLRTVAPLHEPQTQLKLPVPARTLGHLNLRVLKEDGLRDGAQLSAVVARIAAAEPQYAGLVVVADESTWIHTADPMRAVMVRRWPDDDLAHQIILPVAALAAPSAATGRPLLADLAERFWGGDLSALVGTYLRTLLGWHLTLWLRHGIVLEAHGQNVLVAIDRSADQHDPGKRRVRLLMRDLDSGRAYPQALPEPPRDPRMVTTDPLDLSRLFVTTTLHQCALAPLVRLAAAQRRSGASHAGGQGSARSLLAKIRPLLGEFAQEHAGLSDTIYLHHIMEAPRLPVKCGLTAATVLPKTRTGARDVNKFYGADAPSYL